MWRGHQDIDWKLVPAIYRKMSLDPPFADAEEVATSVNKETEALIDRARGHRYGYIEGAQMDDLALLALLQHNGAATPLLDVTTDPVVALYFACQPHAVDGDDVDGALLAIDSRTDRMVQFEAGAPETW